MTILHLLLTLSLLLASSPTLAHPGHNFNSEVASRAEFLKSSPRTLEQCASAPKARNNPTYSLDRRRSLLHLLRSSRGLPNPDSSTLLARNPSCLLQPEVTTGPYFVNGELIRRDITDGQEGIPMWLEVQIIDTSTCTPVPNLYLDIWHCNSTGVYSGVVNPGNGDANDTSNRENTFCRGIQQTDSNGWAFFKTIFPGHYAGRATHIHLLAHAPNATTTYPNNTLTGLTANHIGQLFFNRRLIAAVEATAPYNTNKADIVPNSADSIFAQEAAGNLAYAGTELLGPGLSDGVLAWVNVGVDMSLFVTADNYFGTLGG